MNFFFFFGDRNVWFFLNYFFVTWGRVFFFWIGREVSFCYLEEMSDQRRLEIQTNLVCVRQIGGFFVS